MSYLLLLFLAPTLSILISTPCTPFGVRLQYGQQLVDPSHPQKIVISFNTNQNCPSSFLQILGQGGFEEIDCQTTKLIASENMNFFTTYIHLCSIATQIHFGQTFYYNVFGSDHKEDPIPGLDQWVACNVIDPVKHQGPVNVLAMADWGVISTSGFIPVLQSYRTVMKEQEFKLVAIAGDIAYNLDSNNGTNYVQWLQMAQEILKQTPCVFTRGNHQNYSEDDKLLLNTTFRLYNLSEHLATGFQFGDSYIISFDPFQVAYWGNTNDTAPLQALQLELKRGQQKDLFLLPFSHYPVICSGEPSTCQAVNFYMHDIFSLMLSYGVSFYIGAHAHVYQRIYPYFANGTFQQLESPYRDDGGYLISVVEGVAGSDSYMVLQMAHLYNYTAAYTVNETGFGVLTLNDPKEVTYRHYSTKRGYVDTVVVEKVQRKEMEKEIDSRVQAVELMQMGVKIAIG